eukprot:TRINITY_DN1715_c0_g1_i1.p4 TRINITY_DN1715_c0_g1~~TRINITY_DN1715_c0_g1_i1.p4  ORF type:complete len:55 (+),score=17.61 TRINITY_DN1715_c0_g1_i1:242-406(+)
MVIDGAKKDKRVRQLAASFLPSFFHMLPEDLMSKGWEAFLDLCEDEEPVIRQYA